jgi:hypothetical protein
MNWTLRRNRIVVTGVLLACASATASEIGQQVAGRINAATYQYYLDHKLYTHNFDVRSAGWWYGGLGPEHDPARDNILEIFQSLGLSAELEPIDAEGEFYNVVATQLGTVYLDSYYVVGAHYDSAGTPGADDDASGVAGLLEIARVLSLYTTEYTIKYIAFDQEEEGLVGSSAYVDEHLTDDIRGMVELDMIAYDHGGYTCEVRGTTQSDPIKLALADAIDTYGGSMTATVGGAEDSDHAPFEWAGFQACLLIEPDARHNPCYHHSCDSVDHAGYINYAYAADLVRSTAGFLADQAVAQPLFDCETGAGCEPGAIGDEDCNGNGVWDVCDVICGGAPDCNANRVPDECDPDANGDGVPDACQPCIVLSEIFESGLPPGWSATGLWHVTDQCPRDDSCSPTHWAYYGQDGTCNFDVGLTTGVLTAPPFRLPPIVDIDTVTLTYCSTYGGEGGPPTGYDAAWVTANGIVVDDAGSAGEQGWQTRTVDLTLFFGEVVTLEWHFNSLDEFFNTGLGWQIDDVQVAISSSSDCNHNGTPDFCDIVSGASADCQLNGAPDECEIASGESQDCNGNGVPDECDIAGGLSADCQPNGVPDECELADGTSQDCNGNGVPDECELEFSVRFTLDSNPGWSAPGQWQFGPPLGGGSHNHDPSFSYFGANVYGYNLSGDYTNNMAASYLTTTPIDCTGASGVELRFWRWLGVQAAPYDHASIRVSDNGSSWITIWENSTEEIADDTWNLQVFDISFVADGRPAVYIQWGMGPTDSTVTYPGWNLDEVELHGTRDCNYNGIPDACESVEDCNGNGKLDVCDLFSGTSPDCNANGVPDECDVASGLSTDVNANLIPDECESVGDLNCDGVTDLGDINPFVLFLSNYAGWLATFPGCDPSNGDINGDGTYGQWAFDDINPFVFLLTAK